MVQSFEVLAENLVDMNSNFTNLTLRGTNLFFQGMRVSSPIYIAAEIVVFMALNLTTDGD